MTLVNHLLLFLVLFLLVAPATRLPADESTPPPEAAAPDPEAVEPVPGTSPATESEPGMLPPSAVPVRGAPATLAVRGVVALPVTGDEWALGLGVEGQWRHWMDDGLGVALAAGWSSWRAKSGAISLPNYTLQAPELTGSAGLVSAGGSLLLRPFPRGAPGLTVELGARYVMVDSDVRVHFRYPSRGGMTDVPAPVRFDDRAVAVAGLEWEGRWSEGLKWFLAAGACYDFSSGQANWLYEDLANDFTALQALAGLGGRF